jgi:hypothetical protein
MAPLHERITFPQSSANKNGSPLKLFGEQAPLACSNVFDGSACHPIPVGKPVLTATVTAAEPVAEPNAAEIVSSPAATPLTRPVAFTVATLVFDDDQLPESVISFVLPSLNFPVAVKYTGAPRTTNAFEGVTAIETTLDGPGPTVRTVAELTDFEVAPILLSPCATPVAIPEPLIVATAVFEDVQLTELVRSCLLPSLNVPSAVKCWFCPAPIEGFPGVIASDDKLGELGGFVAPFDPPPPPHPLIANNPATRKAHATIDRNHLPSPTLLITDLWFRNSLPRV